jgi:hypothetical protein
VIFSFVFEKNTYPTTTKTVVGKNDARGLFGVSPRRIPQFILGLTKYLVYCLTVIWLTINNNKRRLLRGFSTRLRIGNVARGWIWISTVLAFVLLSTFGCEDFDAPEKDSGTSSRSDETGMTTNVATGLESDAGKSSEMDAAQEDAEAPTAEKDDESLKTDFVVAQSSEDFIFIPNPKNHCVTVIDGVSLIKAQSNIAKCISCKKGECVGNNPTYMGVHPSKNIAIVVDKGTRYAAIIEKSRAEEIVTRIEVVKGANAIRFAPGKNHAIVYYDPEYVGDIDEASGNQEVTVVSLDKLSTGEDDAKLATNLIVGLQPRELVFENDGKQAFFLTDDGISVIDYAKIDDGEDDSSAFATPVDFKDRLDPAKAQIAIAPGGRFATGFVPGNDELFLLDITAAYEHMETIESVWSLKMDDFFLKSDANGGNGNNGSGGSDEDDAGRRSPVYDIDEDEIDPRPELPEDVVPGIADVAISPAGSTSSFVMVTIPNPGLVLEMNFPEVFKAESVLDEVEFYLVNEGYDRVLISSDGKKSWLFNQEDKTLRTVLLDLTDAAPPAILDEDWANWAFNHIKYINVAHPISRAEALKNDHAIVAFHEPASALRTTTRGIGYTIINLDEGAGRFNPTPKPIQSYVTYKHALFAMMKDDPLSIHQIFRTGLQDLLSKSIELKGKPKAIGVMDGETIESIFVNHEHPDGHVILISDEGKVITNPFIGFQIANRVQEN